MKNIYKAIETEYRGYRFRSRLEARWAYFLDCMGEPWEYEKEGYTLPSGWYLPDFWLPRQKAWLEIKGAKPTAKERKRCEELVSVTGNECVLASGEPYPGFSGPGTLHIYKVTDEWRRAALAAYGYWMDFVEEGLALDRYHYVLKEKDIARARGVRFEHGQQPKPQPILRTDAEWRIVKDRDIRCVRLLDIHPWLAKEAIAVRDGHEHQVRIPFVLNGKGFAAVIDSACRHIRIGTSDNQGECPTFSTVSDDPIFDHNDFRDDLPQPDELV